METELHICSICVRGLLLACICTFVSGSDSESLQGAEGREIMELGSVWEETGERHRGLRG